MGLCRKVSSHFHPIGSVPIEYEGRSDLTLKASKIIAGGKAKRRPRIVFPDEPDPETVAYLRSYATLSGAAFFVGREPGALPPAITYHAFSVKKSEPMKCRGRLPTADFDTNITVP